MLRVVTTSEGIASDDLFDFHKCGLIEIRVSLRVATITKPEYFRLAHNKSDLERWSAYFVSVSLCENDLVVGCLLRSCEIFVVHKRRVVDEG